jgi:hypothetical protein
MAETVGLDECMEHVVAPVVAYAAPTSSVTVLTVKSSGWSANVKAELGAHGKHGGILGEHLAADGLETLLL